jgi:hypothetical protein
MIRPSRIAAMPTASDTRAPDDAGEHVATELVGAEPVGGRRRATILGLILSGSCSGRIGAKSAARLTVANQPTPSQKPMPSFLRISRRCRSRSPSRLFVGEVPVGGFGDDGGDVDRLEQPGVVR